MDAQLVDGGSNPTPPTNSLCRNAHISGRFCFGCLLVGGVVAHPVPKLIAGHWFKHTDSVLKRRGRKMGIAHCCPNFRVAHELLHCLETHVCENELRCECVAEHMPAYSPNARSTADLFDHGVRSLVVERSRTATAEDESSGLLDRLEHFDGVVR